MAIVFDEEHGIQRCVGVNKMDYLITSTESNINPPWRCSICGRHISKLKPFGKGGDPLVGDFDGALLLRYYLRIAPFTEVVDPIFYEFFGKYDTEKDYPKAKEELAEKYGEEKARYIVNWKNISGRIGSYWLCRDCVCLDDLDFMDNNFYQDMPKKCGCCGKDLVELISFTEEDPVRSYFIGKPLARIYRPDTPSTEKTHNIIDEFFANCITLEDHLNARKKLFQKYGEEEAENVWKSFKVFLDGLLKPSWECKDCIGLNTHQYFKKKMAQEFMGHG